MNLRDLEYLLAVAKHKNFSTAARECAIGQPTLSTQIKKLEEELGYQIFDRNNKLVRLRDDAEAILLKAKEALQAVNEIYTIAENLRKPYSGSLKIGAFPTIASYILPDFASRIKNQFPELKLILKEEKTATLIEDIHNGVLDCALLALPVDTTQLEYAEIIREDFYLAVNQTHPLAKRKKIKMDLLANEKLMLLDEGHCLRDQALPVCKLINVSEEDFRATSISTLLEMVRLGTGITLAPQSAQANYPDLVFIPFQGKAPGRTIALAWSKISSKKYLFSEITEILR